MEVLNERQAYNEDNPRPDAYEGVIARDDIPIIQQEELENAADVQVQQSYQMQHRNWRQIFIVVCILLTECCERLAYYGVTANLTIFLGILHMESPSPSTVSLAFSGVCFFSPLLGGLLADVRLGRFNTIFGAALLYILGTAFLCASTHEYNSRDAFPDKAKETLLVLALLLIALGSGGIKANVSPFGADQVRDGGTQAVEKFFLWFYWFIQVGALLAYTVITYLQQEVSFFYGYLAAACSMCFAVVVFILSRNSYATFPPLGSFLIDACKILWSALKSPPCKKRTRDTEVESCLDRAKKTRGGLFPDMQVEDLKLLLKILPIFLTSIMFWTMYAQVQTSYLAQGLHMKLVLSDDVTVPVASLNVFEVIPLLILIPLVDKFVFPAIAYCGLQLTPLRKMGAGMLFAAASAGVAGWVEIWRKKSIRELGYFHQHVFRAGTNVSQMSVFYQVPQYVLLGTGEVLVAVTGLEFAYSESPRYVHGVVIGVYLAMIGAGFFLASALVAVVSKLSRSQWYPVDPDKGSLEKYFFLLVGLMLANFLVFVAISVRYRYNSCVSPRDRSRRSGVSGRRRRSR